MKIVHINTSQEGGAALCAIRISKALCSKGINSKMIFADGNKDANIDVVEKNGLNWSSYKLIRLIQVIFNRLHLWPIYSCYLMEQYNLMMKYGNKIQFSSPITLYQKLVEHPWIKDADIIHLHWISNFVDYPSFFPNINKPIVWTLHDENPGLGGFHYTSTKCDNLIEEYENLENKFISIKHKQISSVANKIHLVALSTEMRKFIENNEILQNCRCRIIHNGVNSEIFVIRDKNVSKKNVGLKNHTDKVFLFSSFDLYDKRKGLQLLIKALEQIAKKEHIILICLGNYSKKPVSHKFEIICPGLISDVDLLVSYYNAADYFVLSSFQEAFAQTPLESMSCGTPVVAFPCSGVKDLINDFNGIVCDDFTVEALHTGIIKIMQAQYDSKKIHEYIVKNFSYDVISSQYINLYNSILKEL